MKLSLIVFFALGVTHGLFAQFYNNHEYFPTSSYDLTWAEAEAEAIALNSHLVTVNDAAEEQWLENTFGTFWFWIGFTDQAVGGEWRWTNGEPVTYTDWNPGEPNDQLGNENWAGLTYPQNPGWNDFPNWYRMAGIIEVVPEPSVLLGLGLAGTLLTLRRRKR